MYAKWFGKMTRFSFAFFTVLFFILNSSAETSAGGMHPWASDVDTHVNNSAAIQKLAEFASKEDIGSETWIRDAHLIGAMGKQHDFMSPT